MDISSCNYREFINNLEKNSSFLKSVSKVNLQVPKTTLKIKSRRLYRSLVVTSITQVDGSKFLKVDRGQTTQTLLSSNEHCNIILHY